MDESTVASLRQQAEPLSAVSITHLTLATRHKLSGNDLSVNAYPTLHGGFVYVGSPRYDTPAETDLGTMFEAAEQAGIVWLKFDDSAAVIDGLPIYPTPGDNL